MPVTKGSTRKRKVPASVSGDGEEVRLASTPPASPDTASASTTTASTTTTGTKLSKSDKQRRIREAREKARAWAEAQKKKKEEKTSSKKAAAAVAASETTSAPSPSSPSAKAPSRTKQKESSTSPPRRTGRSSLGGGERASKRSRLKSPERPAASVSTASSAVKTKAEEADVQMEDGDGKKASSKREKLRKKEALIKAKKDAARWAEEKGILTRKKVSTGGSGGGRKSLGSGKTVDTKKEEEEEKPEWQEKYATSLDTGNGMTFSPSSSVSSPFGSPRSAAASAAAPLATSWASASNAPVPSPSHACVPLPAAFQAQNQQPPVATESLTQRGIDPVIMSKLAAAQEAVTQRIIMENMHAIPSSTVTATTRHQFLMEEEMRQRIEREAFANAASVMGTGTTAAAATVSVASTAPELQHRGMGRMTGVPGAAALTMQHPHGTGIISTDGGYEGDREDMPPTVDHVPETFGDGGAGGSAAAKFRAAACSADFQRRHEQPEHRPTLDEVSSRSPAAMSQRTTIPGSSPLEEQYNMYQRSKVPRAEHTKIEEHEFHNAEEYYEEDRNESFKSTPWCPSNIFKRSRRVLKNALYCSGILFMMGFGGASVYWALANTVHFWGPLTQSPSASTDVATTMMEQNGSGSVAPIKPETVEINLPPCFFDSDGVPKPKISSVFEEGHEEESGSDFAAVAEQDDETVQWWTNSDQPPSALVAKGISSCRLPQVPCPSHGRCSGAFLRDCLADSYESVQDIFVVSDAFDSCVLSPYADGLVESITQALINLTVEQTCGVGCRASMFLGTDGGCSIPTSEIVKSVTASKDKDGVHVKTNPTMFTVRGIVDLLNSKQNKEMGEEEDDLKVTDDFVYLLVPHFDRKIIQYKPGDDTTGPLLGLTPKYVETDLQFPFLCWMCILLIDIFAFFFGQIIFIVTRSLTLLWWCAWSYPLPTNVALVLLWIIRWVRKRRRERAELRDLVSRVREMAYDKLIECDDGEGYAVLFLRDDLAHELHPTSLRDRKKMFETVWPRVVAEVRLDNRVKKVQRIVGGKPLEHWEWISVPGRKSRSAARK